MSLAAYGIWVLFSGEYTYRPGRGNGTVTLLALDARLMGLFQLFLAVLVTALGVSGRKAWWCFRIGLAGAVLCLVVEGARQLMRIAVHA
ncbi:hypothetical protein RT97_20965 [Variovorax paradoxus]|uniref:Uncharacterized protein n=1 Tax=Variovorax paradoxus TaxID=34073 RepID=A0A0D0LG84_VARPD|nr:hypothetical protein RT97_20965 [Variovorax paradoxus]